MQIWHHFSSAYREICLTVLKGLWQHSACDWTETTGTKYLSSPELQTRCLKHTNTLPAAALRFPFQHIDLRLKFTSKGVFTSNFWPPSSPTQSFNCFHFSLLKFLYWCNVTLEKQCCFSGNTFLVLFSLFTDDEQVSAVWRTTVDVLFAVTWSPLSLGWAGLKRLTEKQNQWTHHQLCRCLRPQLGSPSSSLPPLP